MDQFLKLEPDLRAWALVGRFLHDWAFVEEQLGNVIAKALNLTSVQTAILGANLTFKAKIDIAKSVLEITFFSKKTDKESFSKTLKDIADFYTRQRNLIAHVPFGPSDDSAAVQFLQIKAKGELKFLSLSYSLKDFEELYNKMNVFCKRLDALESVVSNSALIDALLRRGTADETAKNSGIGALGLLGATLTEGAKKEKNTQ